MYRPLEHKIKCDFLRCFAGMGQAGNGKCFLGGIYWNNNCPAFRDEDEEIKRLEREESENCNRMSFLY